MLIFGLQFNFWWSAGMIDELKPHLPHLSSQKNKMLIFGLHSTSDDRPGWSMDSNPVHHLLSSKKKLNAHFWITFNFWWSQTGLPPLSRWTSDDRPGWSMDLNPICHPSPVKKILNAHFWITFNFWWLAGLVNGLKPRSATPLQPKK